MQRYKMDELWAIRAIFDITVMWDDYWPDLEGVKGAS